jgi:hypothetical protein
MRKALGNKAEDEVKDDASLSAGRLTHYMAAQ